MSYPFEASPNPQIAKNEGFADSAAHCGLSYPQLLQKILTLVEQAPNVQLWYDQYLAPSVAEVHKDTSQALFALSITPEEAARQLQQASTSFKDQ